jgi:HemK-related putative methylase
MMVVKRSRPPQPGVASEARLAQVNGAPEPHAGFVSTCPGCRAQLEQTSEDTLHCPVEGREFKRDDGIWRFLLPERSEIFERFIADYEAIRRAEGRGSDDASYYRALPERDITGRFESDWRIRARSYEALVRHVVEPLERRKRRPLRILDLGAGNCWLSNRLALRGHRLAAVDLLTNDFDGLGVHARYLSSFTSVQSEFDRLPFDGSQFDLAIFNGSLHYSTDYMSTLSETLRVLSPDGALVVLDSPVYRDPESGRKMVHEREADFERRFGFPSNALPSENFLTYDRLHEIEAALGLRWRQVSVSYGLRWRMRPWKARVLRRREPAAFLLLVGEREPVRQIPSVSRRIVRWLARRLLGARFRLTQRHRHGRVALEIVAGRPILVLPEVFNPALFRSGEFLAETLEQEPLDEQSSVLDMGTGAGAAAVVAASRSARVTAVDINPEAVRCARINALLNEVDDRVDARAGDLFQPVAGDRFDLVLFNPPYYRGHPNGLFDHAWRSEDVVERFAAGLGAHLNERGSALVVLSSDGESDAFLRAFRDSGLDVSLVARSDLLNETLTVYRLQAEG